jgi:hypothetical protein
MRPTQPGSYTTLSHECRQWVPVKGCLTTSSQKSILCRHYLSYGVVME